MKSSIKAPNGYIFALKIMERLWLNFSLRTPEVSNGLSRLYQLSEGAFNFFLN